jgi:hypothetical protein
VDIYFEKCSNEVYTGCMLNVRPIVAPCIKLVKLEIIRAKAKATIDHCIKEYGTLFQAFCVALSLHVAFLPVMWIAGWALPWPRVPIITTIMEYDLRGWTDGRMPKPKRIFDIMDPDLNK